jgi:hypothetical protein
MRALFARSRRNQAKVDIVKNCSHHAVLVLAVLGLPACASTARVAPVSAQASGAALLPVLIRQTIRTDMTMQALLMGRLHLDPHGCLRGDSDEGPIIIWHHDTGIERAPDGRIRIADNTTGNAVHVGDEIALSGGYRAGPVSNVTEPVPQACQPPKRFFIAGRVMSEAQRQDMLGRQRSQPAAALPGSSAPEPTVRR